MTKTTWFALNCGSGIQYQDTVSRYGIEIRYWDMISRYDIKVRYRDTISRYDIEIRHRDTVSRHGIVLRYQDSDTISRYGIEIRYRDTVSRYGIEIRYRNTVSRYDIEIVKYDIEIWHRDTASRYGIEIRHRDTASRHNIEIRHWNTISNNLNFGNFKITEPVKQRSMTKECARAVRARTACAHALRWKNSQIFSLAQKTNLLHQCRRQQVGVKWMNQPWNKKWADSSISTLLSLLRTPSGWNLWRPFDKLKKRVNHNATDPDPTSTLPPCCF
jgi:hypothetical protein